MSQAVEKNRRSMLEGAPWLLLLQFALPVMGANVFSAVMIERLRRGAIHILLTMAFAWGTGMVVNLLT